MKIDLVAWGDTITGLYLKSGGKQSAVSALGFHYSEPVSYVGPVIMEIRKTDSGNEPSDDEMSEEVEEQEMEPLKAAAANPSEADPPKPQKGIALELEKRRMKDPTIVALAALPSSGCRQATVLLAPADGGTFTAYVIDDDPSKLPMGQLRVHNLSPFPIALRENGKMSKELKTKESLLIPAPKNRRLIYELAYKKGDKWKIQGNSFISLPATEQVQMMVIKTENPLFRSTDGSIGGFLQTVTLRR